MREAIRNAPFRDFGMSWHSFLRTNLHVDRLQIFLPSIAVEAESLRVWNRSGHNDLPERGEVLERFEALDSGANQTERLKRGQGPERFEVLEVFEAQVERLKRGQALERFEIVDFYPG